MQLRVLRFTKIFIGAILGSIGLQGTALADPHIRDDIRVMLRDGVELGATLYLPAASGKWPVIVNHTPYIRGLRHDVGKHFAAHGYAFIAIDVRGRNTSGGEFRPFERDAEDAYDTVEWVARQEWSTGDVGMWGSSYGGFNQWAAAKLRPPHLRSIIPTAAVFPGIDFPMRQNIGFPYLASWTALTSGRASNQTLFADQAFWTAVYKRLLDNGVPFARLDDLAGFPSAVYRKWVAHPTFDQYWKSIVPTDREFGEIDLPILSVTGWFDGAQMGALEYYDRHMKFGSASAKDRHFVVLGPQDHTGAIFPRADIGGLSLGPSGIPDIRAIEIAWFDWTIKRGPRPSFLKDNVAYYIIGDDEWRYAPSVDRMSTSSRTYYLDPRPGGAGSAIRPGTLTDESSDEYVTGAGYVYDPADLSKVLLGTWNEGSWLRHQKDVLAIDGDGLVFVTDRLEESVVIAGRPHLELWASMDVPDTDIRARLYVIDPNGASLLLSRDAIRARYRNSLEVADLVEPGKVERYVLDQFSMIGIRIEAGSRLQLVVDPDNSVYSQRNFNSGGIVAEETLADSVTATVTLHRGGEYQSLLSIPVLQ
jgi:uncharacterized protein